MPSACIPRYPLYRRIRSVSVDRPVPRRRPPVSEPTTPCPDDPSLRLVVTAVVIALIAHSADKAGALVNPFVLAAVDLFVIWQIFKAMHS